MGPGMAVEARDVGEEGVCRLVLIFWRYETKWEDFWCGCLHQASIES